MNRAAMALRLTRSGYGTSAADAHSIMDKLSDRELHDFLYLCYRTAEKRGYNQLFPDATEGEYPCGCGYPAELCELPGSFTSGGP